MSTPKLPTLRTLTADLRHMHEAFSHPDGGGEYVHLVYEPDALECNTGGWKLRTPGEATGYLYGREWIPGDGVQFDATSAARRLLAAARDAGQS